MHFILPLRRELDLLHNIRQRDRADQQQPEDQQDHLRMHVLLAEADTQAYNDECRDNAARQVTLAAC